MPQRPDRTGCPPFMLADDCLCSGRTAEWYPYPAEKAKAEKACAFCQLCSHQAECLAWALDNSETFGIWGGATEEQRRKMKRVAKQTIVHYEIGEQNEI